MRNSDDTNETGPNINYEECCLSSIRNCCSGTICNGKLIHLLAIGNALILRTVKKDWPKHCSLVDHLQSSVIDYLTHCRTISNRQRDLYTVTEGDLILNRLSRIIDTYHSSLKICTTHRFTYGVGWSIPTGCSWYDHLTGTCHLACDRVASMHLVKMASLFPYGGRICSNHRDVLYRREKQTEIDSDRISNTHSWELIHHDIGAVNVLLERLDESPIRSQASRIPIEAQATGSKGRLISKL